MEILSRGFRMWKSLEKNINNTYASYHIGWYKNDKGEIDLARNKQDFRKIPLQKSATEILGLDFVEIKPKVKL